MVGGETQAGAREDRTRVTAKGLPGPADGVNGVSNAHVGATQLLNSRSLWQMETGKKHNELRNTTCLPNLLYLLHEIS